MTDPRTPPGFENSDQWKEVQAAPCEEVPAMLAFDATTDAEARAEWERLVRSMPLHDDMATDYDRVFYLLANDPLGICIYDLGESALIIIQTENSQTEGLWALGLTKTSRDVEGEIEDRGDFCMFDRNEPAWQLPDTSQGCGWAYHLHPENGYETFDIHIEYPPGHNIGDDLDGDSDIAARSGTTKITQPTR